MPSKIARAITAKLLEDLKDRRGLRQAWEEIDESIQTEIETCWWLIVDETIAQWKGPAAG